MVLTCDFFKPEPLQVAQNLLGKVIRRKIESTWLSVIIIEAEAYYRREKGSHSSLGRTTSREALFMSPGTIYMYYARGASSLNFSCGGEGNAVLVKSGFPYFDKKSPASTLKLMQKLNPPKNPTKPPRALERICAGQTLLCRSLGLFVLDWNRKQTSEKEFYLEDVGYKPAEIIQTTRLGIPIGRDEHLPYRFVDKKYAAFCTRNPLTTREKYGKKRS